ncbi:MAG: iron-sulfur cluster assembly scaffold protein [Amphritea sp.]
MNHSLYNAAIKALARRCDKDRTELGQSADVSLINPYCGDRVRLRLDVKDGVIYKLRHEVNGCLLCKAACTLMRKLVENSPEENLPLLIQELRGLLQGEESSEVGLQEIEVFSPVISMKSRHQCVLLPFEALHQCYQECRTQADETG